MLEAGMAAGCMIQHLAFACAMLCCPACSQVLDYADLSFDTSDVSPPASPVQDGGPTVWEAGGDAPAPVDPSCDATGFALDGFISGETVKSCYARSSYGVNQVGSPAVLETVFGTNGLLHLQWSGNLTDNVVVAVTGALTMPEEGPQAGQQYCVNAGTLQMVTLQGASRYYTFDLVTLSQGPTCPGAAVAGHIAGDFRTQ
jgi:hypothetical protein